MFESILKIIGLISTILIPILLFSLNRKNEKLRMIQNKVSDKKYETYVEFYSLFFDISVFSFPMSFLIKINNST